MRKRKTLILLMSMLLATTGLLAQNKTVTGRVTDSTGQPVSQVSVVATGTRTGTVTDNNGSFTLTVNQSVRTLDFSSIGYTFQRVTIPQDGSAEVTLMSTRQNNELDEVVVTGYTRERKSTYAGAVSKVSAKEINQIPVATIDQILQGRAPGLVVGSGSGQPGTPATVIVRGLGTINGESDPLYVVDGIPLQGDAFSGLNTSDIESVDVLKDAAATSLYGSRGSNGVIVITTKRGRAGSKLTFGFKTQTGFSNRTTPKFDMMNSQQRIQYEEEVGLESGLNIGPGWTYSRKNPSNAGLAEATLTGYDQIRDSLSNMNVDWRDIFFRKGKFQEHELNATGGSDKLGFYSSLTYYEQEGIALRSSLKKVFFKKQC